MCCLLCLFLMLRLLLKLSPCCVSASALPSILPACTCSSGNWLKAVWNMLPPLGSMEPSSHWLGCWMIQASQPPCFRPRPLLAWLHVSHAAARSGTLASLHIVCSTSICLCCTQQVSSIGAAWSGRLRGTPWSSALRPCTWCKGPLLT